VLNYHFGKRVIYVLQCWYNWLRTCEMIIILYEGNSPECKIICHKGSKMYTKWYFDFHQKYLITITVLANCKHAKVATEGSTVRPISIILETVTEPYG
jgi:hypothetical protein